jgi:hypothetical protein
MSAETGAFKFDPKVAGRLLRTCWGSVFRAEDSQGVGFLYIFTHAQKFLGLARGRFSLCIYIQDEIGLRGFIENFSQ